MTFEQFEKILYPICEKEEIAGAAAHGSDDFYVKLWRCYGNDKLCQVHQLYDGITKFIELEKELERIKGQNEILRQFMPEVKGGEE